MSVNWQDGMLIKSLHFIEQEDYFETLNRWMLANITDFYGLTRPAIKPGSSFNARLDHDGQNWVVILSKCFGFTASGKIIQIDSEYDNTVKTGPIPGGHTANIPVYIYASGVKVNLGMPAGTDMSTRYPYRCYEYKLLVGEAADIDPADCLKIAEITFGDGQPQLAQDFIPPCSTIGAHPVLADYCFRIKGILTQARQSALAGFQAFTAAAQGKGAKFGPEHKAFQDILSRLSIDLGGKLKVHPRPDLSIPPFMLFAYYQEIFGGLESMLDTYADAANTLRKKYAGNELFNRFIAGIAEFSNGRYNHQEIGKMLKALVILMNDFVEFVNLIGGLAGVLPKTGKLLHYRQKEYHLHAFSSITTKPERDGLTVKILGLNSAVTRDIITTMRKELFSGVDHRYIMVKIGVNDNDVPGRMDPVYVDAETSSESLIFKPMDDLKHQSIDSINLNLRGNFNPQALANLTTDSLSVFIY